MRTVLRDGEREAEKFRATVHVEDALVRNALYQLVDYWPSGKGAGRRFSVRFGILGRAWRLGYSLYASDVPVSEDRGGRQRMKDVDGEKALIEQWGMTRAQARTAATGQRSFVCIVLHDEGQRVGILYMDAQPARAFDGDIDGRCDAAPATRELAGAVGRVRKGVATKGPGIKLLDED